MAKVHSNCFRNVYKWILPIAESRCQLFQECVAPSSKPLLAGASGKGLLCRELAWKCGWNEFFKLMFYMFCQFIRRLFFALRRISFKMWFKRILKIDFYMFCPFIRRSVVLLCREFNSNSLKMWLKWFHFENLLKNFVQMNSYWCFTCFVNSYDDLLFCQFVRQSMQKHWSLCVVHNKKCKFSRNYYWN